MRPDDTASGPEARGFDSRYYPHPDSLAPWLPSPYMTILSRPTFAMSLLGALFCSTPPPAVEPRPRPASAGSTLVVLLTVDQLRQDYLDKWHDQFTGGLRRLVDSGAYFTNAHHDHAI